MTLVYEVGDGLYVNLTNRCSCACTFCLRQSGDSVGGADSLWLEREPTFEEVMAAFEAFDVDRYREVVFCGYGEPTEAFDLLVRVARAVKERYGKPIRLNTNGQGSLINGRDIAPELEGVVDSVSISLNTPDAARYQQIVRSRYGEAAFQGMLDFAREARRYVPQVTMTTVETTLTPPDAARYQQIVRSRYGEAAFQGMLDFAREARRYVPQVTMTTVETTLTPEEEERCRAICEELGVRYRIREWVE